MGVNIWDLGTRCKIVACQVFCDVGSEIKLISQRFAASLIHDKLLVIPLVRVLLTICRIKWPKLKVMLALTVSLSEHS